MSDHPPISEAAILYRVALKVRPLPGHPLYWKCGIGILNVWLYADSPEEASARAETILGALPYELVGEQSVVFGKPTGKQLPASACQSAETAEQFKRCEQLAQGSGLELFLIVVEVGADETGFETMPLV